MDALRDRAVNVPTTRRCACVDLAVADVLTCGGGFVSSHRFVAFPCGHAFRVWCLEQAAARLLTTTSGSVVHKTARASTEALEASLTAECPLCGDSMVRSVSCPFVDTDAEADLVRSWAIQPQLSLPALPYGPQP